MDHVKMLEGLVAIDTTVPPGRNYWKSLDYLEPFFKGAGCKTQIVHVPAEFADDRTGRVALIGHRRYPGKPRLIFYGHVDVVPAEGWQAFTPRLEDGKVFGRGAADMKGGIVALALALNRVKNRALKYDTTIAVTTDEEYSQAGQLHYLKKYLEPVDGAYVFSLDNSFGYVSITGLGSLGLIIKVKGRSVHSALAHLGVNAVEQAVPLLNALLELKKKVTQRSSQTGAAPDTGLKRMEARLNITLINGGLKSNIIPDECTFGVDRRLIPEESIKEAEKEIIDTLKAVPGVDWEVDQVFRIPTVPPVSDPVVDKLAGIIKEVTGETGLYGEMGSGDLSSIVQKWGGKEFGSGVIRTESNIHGKNEFVRVKDIEDLAKVIDIFLTGKE